ncbi:hypothetical protein N7478_007230 [Penicillium angulare]|uniref:uncharacterized protein n=1 Tax=Penicillium angulare TaxID=116970 RepID=UPI00253FAD4B|nr:uncharacterized protein N7478_007230 [Penicillium angulare]KAJ5281858.1 hypothetical protein N7478_007230 [Penicillium angulare]
MPKNVKTTSSQAMTKSTPTKGSESFHADQITLSTFQKLLKCYPAAVKHVHHHKLLRKFQPKKKGSRSAKNIDDADLIQEADLSPSTQSDIQSGLIKFLKLDAWRYEEMPALIATRRGTSKNDIMSKDELTSVMEWKTTHGHSRPMLMGMIKSNQDKLVQTCISAANTALPTADTEASEAFPQKSFDALQPLRGVGPATASLILSIMTGSSGLALQVPFYSDEVYFWLALNDYPDMQPGTKRVKEDLKVKYNLNEYKELWSASVELSQRLNLECKRVAEDGDGEVGISACGSVSQIDIEKVAYVLRNIEISGYFDGQDTSVLPSGDTARAEKEEEHEEGIENSRKRKGEDENKQNTRKKRG